MYAVAADPLRETGQRMLIEAHLREGNVSEARRQFELYRSVLLDRLGITPSRSVERLVSGETADVVRFGTGRSSRPGG